MLAVSLFLATVSAKLMPMHVPVCSSSPFGVSNRQHPFQSDYSQIPINEVHHGPSQWSHSHCLSNGTDPFCAFTSHSFAAGRGISIVTTAERAEHFADLAAFATPGALLGINAQPSPPFEERELPGRGRGLIANTTILRGDRIFAHTPLVLLDGDLFEDLETPGWLELEKAAVRNLPALSRNKFYELFGQPVTHPVADKIDTNAFELELDDEDDLFYGVFPEIARLNHDCRPNAAYFFDQQTLTHYVHATTDIQAGAEITITYIDPHTPRRKRLQKLKRSWGFVCSCSACTQHRELTQASDQRLRLIEEVEERLQDWQTAEPQIAQMLISLYEQEGLHAPKTEAYRLAALTSCAAGKRWDAVKFASLAVQMGMLDGGFADSQVKDMRMIMDQPENQACWRKNRQLS